MAEVEAIVGGHSWRPLALSIQFRNYYRGGEVTNIEADSR